MVEERRPQKGGLVKESDAYESREGVCHFKSDNECGPSHDVEGCGDSVTLERWQRQEDRPTKGRRYLGMRLHTRLQEVEEEEILEEYSPSCLHESSSF